MKRQVTVAGIDVARTLKPLAIYASDPTTHLRSNQFARATRTPSGPATVEIRWDDCTAQVQVWGDGSSWILEHLDHLLGLTDDVSDFDPPGDVVAKLARRSPGLRLTASHTLWHDIVWLIPGQRVSSDAAARQWRAIVRKFSQPGPGPLDLMLPPAAEVIAKAHYTDFHDCGIERSRAENLRAAGKYIPRFERSLDLPAAELQHKLQLIKGVGPWTSTNLLTMTAGHADEVVIGDYGLPSMVTWALAGIRKGTDEQMVELLEPYRPHRWRVCRLLMASPLHPPRRGPRVRNPRIQGM